MALSKLITDLYPSLHGKVFGISRTGQLVVNGTPVSGPTLPSVISPIWAGASESGGDPSTTFEIYDDFMDPATSATSANHIWTVLSDGATGTPVYQDAAGGIFNVVTAAADNDYSAYSSFHEPFKFASGKPLWFEARFKIAGATVLASTWWFGLTDTLTTGGMQADALGPLATYDGALIHKTPETAMTVAFETSNAGTQVTTASLATSITDTWHKAGFYFDGAATTSKIYPFFHNGTSWTAGAAHDITLSGLEEMHMVFGVKAGPTGAAETLQVDYIKCRQVR